MGFLQRINSKFLVISLSVLLLLYFVVFPLAILLYDSVLVDGAFTLENYREVYSKDVNWRALANTVELSLMLWWRALSLPSLWRGWLAVPICRGKKATARFWLPVT